jgi:hypothetical protein
MIQLSHFGAIKIVVGILVVDAVTVAMDPTIKVALIVAVPSFIGTLGTLILGFMTLSNNKSLQRKQDKIAEDQEKMSNNIDGHFKTLLAEKAVQGAELLDKTDKLAHAEGRREGIEATEGKDKV